MRFAKAAGATLLVATGVSGLGIQSPTPRGSLTSAPVPSMSLPPIGLRVNSLPDTSRYRFRKPLPQAAKPKPEPQEPAPKRVVRAAPKATKKFDPVAVPHVAHTRAPCAPSAGEAWIISRESGGSTTDWNPVNTPTGHAFGLGQLTGEIRREQAAKYGYNPNTTNYCEQLRMMRGYIADRYGSTAAAVAWWRAHRWY